MAYRLRSPSHIGILFLIVLVCVYLYDKQSTNLRSSILQFSVNEQTSSADILQSLSLTEDQCRAAFPGLTKEIDDAVARGPFPLKRQPGHYTGLVQGRIKDGKVYFTIKPFNSQPMLTGNPRYSSFLRTQTLPKTCSRFASFSSRWLPQDSDLYITGANVSLAPNSPCNCYFSLASSEHYFRIQYTRYSNE